MSEQMHPIEVKNELYKLGLCLPILRGINTTDLLSMYSFNDTMGPFLDPTAWIATQDKVDTNHKIVKALAAFQKVLDEELGPYDPEALVGRLADGND